MSIDLGAGASAISFIGAATESSKDRVGVLTFSDGSTQEVAIQFGDWVGASGNPAYGNTVVALSNGRLSGTGAEGSVKRTAMYATAPVDLDTDQEGTPKIAVSLTLPQEEGTLRADGRIHLFAIASDGDLAAIEELSLTAATVDAVPAGVEFQTLLATITGPGEDSTATINWGDGSPVVNGTVVDSAVSGTHTYAAAGSYDVTVTVDNGITSAATGVQIEAITYEPTLTATPDPVEPGQSIRVDGTGFAPGEDVTVTFASDPGIVVTADAAGTFRATVTIAPDVTDGDYPVVGVGGVSLAQAHTTVRVEAAVPGAVATSTSLSTTATDVIVGDRIELIAAVSPETVSGSIEILTDGDVIGSGPVSGGIASVGVQPETSGQHVYTARFTPDDADAFTSSTSAPLTVEVRSMPVLEPELKLSLGSVEQGGRLSVTGYGFAPGEQVRIDLHSDPVNLGTATADAAGAFTADVVIAADTPVGEHTVVVTGVSSGLSAEADLTVTAAPDGDDPAGGADDGATGTPGTGGDGLSTTGQSVAWLVIVAASLLLIGVAVLVARKRAWGTAD